MAPFTGQRINRTVSDQRGAIRQGRSECCLVESTDRDLAAFLGVA